MYVDENDRQKLSFNITNTEIKKTSTIKLKLLDINKQIIPTSLKTDAKIKISSTEFHRICKEMSSISDKMEIVCTYKEIQFRCHGDSAEKTTSIISDKDNAHTGVQITLASHFKNPEKVIIQGIFELKNLSTFAKCQTFCKYVLLFMSNERELCLNYKIGAIGNINVAISPVSSEKTISDDEFYGSDDNIDDIELLDNDL
jgi:proliferating cell nuclear antigen